MDKNHKIILSAIVAQTVILAAVIGGVVMSQVKPIVVTKVVQVAQTPTVEPTVKVSVSPKLLLKTSTSAAKLK